MERMPIVHAELTCDGRRILCGEVIEPRGARRDLSNTEFTEFVSGTDGAVLTWGGCKWAEAAGLPKSRLIDLNETFLAANGFRVRIEAFGPGRASHADTVAAMRDWLVRCGRLQWRTRKGEPRGFWVPNFGCPVAQLYYMPSPFK
jgi:hypothetical protein